MQHPGTMRCHQRVDQRQPDPRHLRRRQRATRTDLVRQRAAADELHHDPGAPVLLHDVEHAQRMRVVDRRDRAGFAQRAFRQPFALAVADAVGVADLLRSNASLEQDVVRLPDHAHAAATELVVEPVAAGDQGVRARHVEWVPASVRAHPAIGASDQVGPANVAWRRGTDVDADVPPVTAPQFAITDRGYDREQVDEFVTQLQQKLDDARERLTLSEADHARAFDGLHRRIAELEDREIAGERGELESTDRDFRALGTRIGRMLELADAEADAMRSRAARQADEIVARARREAERLTTEEQEKRENLQRQLRALHESLASVLGVLPTQLAAAAGVTTDDAAAAAADDAGPPDVIDLTPEDSPGTAPADPYPSSSGSSDVWLDDLLDDSTQVVPVIREDKRS
jgi:cell division septum initiation protein DivIVA